MELSLGIVLQISIYVLTGSAVALMVLEWYLKDRRISGAQEHPGQRENRPVLGEA
jgi:hypothetical protein